MVNRVALSSPFPKPNFHNKLPKYPIKYYLGYKQQHQNNRTKQRRIFKQKTQNQ